MSANSFNETDDEEILNARRVFKELKKHNITEEDLKNIAETNENCYIVDLYKYSGITEGNCSVYMTDSEALHPNEQGMKMIAGGDAHNVSGIGYSGLAFSKRIKNSKTYCKSYQKYACR